MEKSKREVAVANALTKSITMLGKIRSDNNAFCNIGLFGPLIIIIAAVLLCLYSSSTVQAEPYIISQDKTFSLQLFNDPNSLTQVSQEDFNINNPNWPNWNIKDFKDTVDLNFNGAQSSIIVDGNNWELTGMTYTLSGNADYTVGVYSTETGWYSNAGVVGSFFMQHYVDPNLFTVPGQETSLSYAGDTLSAYDNYEISGDLLLLPLPDFSDWDGVQAGKSQGYTEQMGQTYSFDKENDDLSLLYNDFTIRLQQTLILELQAWDDGDDYSGVYIRNCLWNGGIKIDYMYEQVPDVPGPEPTPEPATVLLFGTGLAGLAGTSIRRKRNK